MPVQKEGDISFLGEHRLVRPATVGEIEQIAKSLHTRLDNFERPQLPPVYSIPAQPERAASSPHFAAPSRVAEYCGPSISTHINRFRVSAAVPPPCQIPLAKQPTAASQISADTWPVGLRIPRLSKKIPLQDRWKEVVRWWDEADPKIGLDHALKNWKKEWLSGEARAAFAARY